jgi:glycine cleavage system aminomethyltransferase T
LRRLCGLFNWFALRWKKRELDSIVVIMDFAAYEAARTGLVRRDMSHFGRYRVWGKDAANLLHHLTTQDIKTMRPGEVREAALVTSKARVLDWLTVLRRHEADFWVVCSPNRKQSFKTHALRYVLFRQEVTIDDVAADDTLWGVFGPRAIETPGPRWPTKRLPGGGFLSFGAPDDALICDTDTYNVLRVESGLPVAGAELTEEYNPWEAGLDYTVALDKDVITAKKSSRV